jgi:WD40 repeat protein
LFAILQDAKRFVLHKRFIIEKAPLQVYTSALIFTPKLSIIRNRYWNQRPDWIKRFPSVEKNWSGSLQTLEGHSDRVSTVTFSPDGHLLASSSYDHTVRVWDVETGALQRRLEGFNRVTAVTFSHDNRRLATTSDDRIVQVWDIKTATLQNTHKRPPELALPAIFLPSGVLLHAGPVCHIKPDAQRGTLGENPTILSARTFSPDYQLLASTLDDHTIQVQHVQACDAETGTLQIPSTLEGHSDVVQAMTFSPNSELLASASDDHTIRIWDIRLAAPRACSKAGHSRRVRAVRFSPNGRLLASTSDDCAIQIWDTTAGTLQSTLKGHSNWVWPITFSPGGQLIASVSDDHTVWLWDTKTGVLKSRYEGHSAWIRAVVFSSDDQLLVSASDDHTIRLSHIRTGVQNILEGHSKWVLAVTFSPNSQLLASASADQTVRLWNVKTGILQSILEGHSNWVLAVAFSPDGQFLASASSDHTIRLWYAETGYLHGVIDGHSDPVGAVTFSPNGQHLASISYDQTVKLWNTQSNDLLQTFASGDASSRLLYPVDGSYLVTDHGSIAFKDEPVSHYSIDKTKSWITWNDHNVLWLPPEFRPACHEVKTNVLAMGHYSGRICVIEFDPDRRPISELCPKASKPIVDEEAVRIKENCFKSAESAPPAPHADRTSDSHSSAYQPPPASASSDMTTSGYVSPAECSTPYTSPAGESPEYIPSNSDPAEPSSPSLYQTNRPTNPSPASAIGGTDKTPGQTEEPAERKQAAKSCPEHKYIVVKVTKIPHTMRADEFVFSDENKHHRRTKKSDWVRTMYDGNTAWAYKCRKVTYISHARLYKV